MIGRSILHDVSVVVGSDLPETQTTEAERNLLAELLPGARRIVEIGVNKYEGFTTRMQAERSDADTVICSIDPFFAGSLNIS